MSGRTPFTPWKRTSTITYFFGSTAKSATIGFCAASPHFATHPLAVSLASLPSNDSFARPFSSCFWRRAGAFSTRARVSEDG
ncbi:hypothetical protein P8A22_17705 [Streptomyces laculatispora]|uniref:Uncharacterized protein n=1 Tax=Streptomyces laculatispora TaxID=887464 RepID=A0ABY9I4Y4_9ACTN|nr:hypothetical protein [Streptomyces laculatispora]WLQ41659.1 hypothetical protein P8A22_17705 [Streptomyces laculatispora]